MRLIYTLCCLLCLGSQCLIAQNTMPSLLDNANAGTEFVFSMPPCYEQGGSDNKIAVYVSSPYETEVRLEVPGRGVVRTKKTVPNGVIFFPLAPAEAQPFNKNPNQKAPPQAIYPGAAVVITSDDPIVVYTVTRFQFTSDGAMLSPSAALGTEYVVGSMADMSAMYPGLNLPSETTISAIADDTKVWFTLGGNVLTETNNGMEPGQTREFTLKRGDVLAISSITAEGDLSGSYIRSDKPVSVLSGNQCANVPTIIRWCDYIVSAEMPIHSWSTAYHFPRLKPRPNNAFVKIFAAESNTMVQRDGVDFVFIETNKGGVEGTGFYNGQAFDGPAKQLVFTADNPISLKLFNQGQELDNEISDPYSLQLTPVDQYVNYVWFCTPGVAQLQFSENNLSLIHALDANGTVSEDLEFGVLENGVIQWRKVRDVFGAAPGDVYPSIGDGKVWAEKRLVMDPVGAFAIRSLGEPFTAYSYGQSNYDTYAFRTGAKLNDLTSDDGTPPAAVIQTNNGSQIRGSIQDTDAGSNPVGLAAVRVVPESVVNMTVEIDDFVPGTIEPVEWVAEALDVNSVATAKIAMLDRRGNVEFLDLTIEPTATAMEVSPSQISFDQTLVGQVREAEVTIMNTSDSDVLDLNSIRLLDQSSGFELLDLPDGPVRLLPADEISERHILRLTLRWEPTSVGEFSNEILIDANADGEKSFVMITGETLSKSLTISDVTFGQVLNGESLTTTLELVNDGEVEATVTAFTQPTDPAFRIVDLSADLGNLPVSIAAGGVSRVRVSFEPREIGDYSATLEVRYRFGNLEEKSRTVVLSGEGLDKVSSVEPTQSSVIVSGASAYPNPAAVSLRLNFELLSPQPVLARMYDVRGNTVMELPVQQFAAGRQHLKLNVAGLPSGRYFCHLEAGAAIEVVPIVVQR